MTKKAQIVFLLLVLTQFWLPVPIALALDSCISRTIECKPDYFSEGSAEYKLECSIQNDSVFETLNTNSVKLLFDRDPILKGGVYTYHDVNVQSKNFVFNLTGSLTSRATHRGVLQWFPPNGIDYIDFCEGISYQIGAAGSCKVSVPSAIPPSSPLTVKFAGIATTLYRLEIRNSSTPGRTTTLETTTDNQGQGRFPETTVTGGSGNIVSLNIRPISFSGDADRASCKAEVKLDPSVTAPPPPDITPVQPAPAEPVAKKCGEKDEKGNEIICAKAGGDPCTTDPKNPGIKTAIGCIHTKPEALVKDFLTFTVAIGGGIAFLMMLVGAYGMITSAGNPDALKGATDRFTNAIIGLLFVIFAVLLMQIIGVGILNLPGFGK